MIRITRISSFTERNSERATHFWQTAASQPSWITRAALFTFLIVIGLPVLLLFLLAFLLATVVFAVLALFHAVSIWVRGRLPRDDGRENVVVRRSE